MTIDYRALLLKYMQCCITCTGHTHLMWEYPVGLMTPEEASELDSMSEEAADLRRNRRAKDQELTYLKDPNHGNAPIFTQLEMRRESARIVAELTRRDEEAGIRYPEETHRDCCFEGCPKCQPKDESPSMAEIRGMFPDKQALAPRGIMINGNLSPIGGENV